MVISLAFGILFWNRLTNIHKWLTQLISLVYLDLYCQFILACLSFTHDSFIKINSPTNSLIFKCTHHNIIRIHQPRNIFAMHLDLSLNVSTPFGIYFILFYDFDSIAFYDFELVSFYDFDLIPCSFMLFLVRSTALKRRKPCTLNCSHPLPYLLTSFYLLTFTRRNQFPRKS